MIERLQEHLIDGWRCAWRLWSLWLHLIATGAIALYALVPSIPPEVSALVPPAYRGPLLAAWAIFGIVIRMVKQRGAR